MRSDGNGADLNYMRLTTAWDRAACVPTVHRTMLGAWTHSSPTLRLYTSNESTC